MSACDPADELHPAFSGPDATPTIWPDARRQLRDAQVYWLSTVRPDGHPHVTPLLAVWLDDLLWFCTGAEERKAKNLAANPHCVLTTGCNTLEQGLDLVAEGTAVRVTDAEVLHRLAAAYEAKYGSDWHYDVRDGALQGAAGNAALLYELVLSTVFGFGKGEFSQTRWRLR